MKYTITPTYLFSLYMYIWKKISVGVIVYFTVMFDHPSCFLTFCCSGIPTSCYIFNVFYYLYYTVLFQVYSLYQFWSIGPLLSEMAYKSHIEQKCCFCQFCKNQHVIIRRKWFPKCANKNIPHLTWYLRGEAESLCHGGCSQVTGFNLGGEAFEYFMPPTLPCHDTISSLLNNYLDKYETLSKYVRIPTW